MKRDAARFPFSSLVAVALVGALLQHLEDISRSWRELTHRCVQRRQKTPFFRLLARHRSCVRQDEAGGDMRSKKISFELTGNLG